MQLIRKLPTRKNKNGYLESWAVFWCNFCKQEVERSLSNGKKYKSCGCNQNQITHGETKTKLHRVWTDMKTRCLNPNVKQYKYYGGRGITICPEWTYSYIVFRDWALSNGYQENLEIDRRDNNGNYSPENCRFVTDKENSRNRRGRKIKSIEMANEIRDLYKTGNYTRKSLAIKYNVVKSSIDQIISNKTWA